MNYRYTSDKTKRLTEENAKEFIWDFHLFFLLSPPFHFDSNPLSLPPPSAIDLKRELKHFLNPFAMSILTAFSMSQTHVKVILELKAIYL